MKISSIKTNNQFYEFADVWYQRAHRLRKIWQDENEPIERQLKARILWWHMTTRVMKLHQIAIKLSQPTKKPPNKQLEGFTQSTS